MAHASSLSAPAGSSVAYLPLTSTQPDRQPSGTWPRGILKTDGGFADSLKGVLSSRKDHKRHAQLAGQTCTCWGLIPGSSGASSRPVYVVSSAAILI